jgi:hypothetical protein
LKNNYQSGLKGLGKHSNKISLTNPKRCGGSIDIDTSLAKKYPTSNRWDYSFSYNGDAYFVEVHSAQTGEVNTVLKKLKWLTNWLTREASALNNIKANRPYYWIQSNGFNILPNSPQYRQAVQSGILPIGKLSL